MLRTYRSADKRFEFVYPSLADRSERNTFTIVVGKNGTGKSRLLRSVVMHLIDDVLDRGVLAREERLNLPLDPVGELELDYKPSRIVCVSTSPFDKFPVLRRDHFVEGYSYLGFRGLPSMNLALAYLSRVMFTLIDAAEKSNDQANSIAEVLKYLEYEGVIRVKLQFPPSRFVNELISSDAPETVIQEYVNRPMLFAGENGPMRHFLAMGRAQLDEIMGAVRRTHRPRGMSSIEIEVRAGGVEVHSAHADNRDDLLLLARSGFLRLREVTLFKRGVSRPIHLHEASSGEQAVVMGLLGIGSQIRDGALICIDEPEVCLHPEWQEKYIELLFHTFGRFKGCHFLIATHSPQIVAQIPDGDCYVMSMEEGVAKRASDFAGRSIDFQLAEVFNSPGYRNEYLSRIALNAFARVSKAKRFEGKSIDDLAVLRKIQRELRADDPLLDLIYALEEMARTYG